VDEGFEPEWWGGTDPDIHYPGIIFFPLFFNIFFLIFSPTIITVSSLILLLSSPKKTDYLKRN